MISLLQGVDAILHAGDLVSQEVIRLLEAIAPVEAVCGNMDRPDVKRALPSRRIIEAGGLLIGLTHGSGPPWGIRKRIRREFEGVDAVVYGHTHEPFAGCEEGVYFFNPGSAAAPRLAGRPSCGRLTAGASVSGEILFL